MQDLAFTLDDAGNIDAITDGVSSGLSQGFDQDDLNRVTTDAGAYGSKSYTYDEAGNRLTRTLSATTQTLAYKGSISAPSLTNYGGSAVSSTGSPGGSGSGLYIDVSLVRVAPSASVTAQIRNAPGGSGDWLALAAVGASSSSYLQWRYVGSGVHTLDWTVTMPSTPGEYEFRLFLNNGYTIAATSPPVTVASGFTSPTPLTWGGDSNRLLTHTGNTVTLDNAGNTTADPTENLSFVYDDHNRMVEAYVGATLKATYVYNGQGQRVKKVEATGAQRTFIYHYGLAGELLGETIYNSSGAKIGERDYLWLASLPLAQSERVFSGGSVTGSTFVYLHADQLNTPRLATNASGTVVWRWDSDAFGIGAANQDPDSDTNLVNISLRFPGQYLDEETGLHYNYFRDYDAVTGRYIESDPIGLAAGSNTYGYVAGNPLSGQDPSGLECVSANNVTICSHPDPFGPTFRIPTPPAFPATVGADRFLYHDYHVAVPIGCADPGVAFNELLNAPTPGSRAEAASEAGVTNDARPWFYPFANPVTSYLTKDLNTGLPLVVNITGPGSAFPPGYVARMVKNGVLHTYGEGGNWQQAPNLSGQVTQDFFNWLVWTRQSERLVQKAQQGCVCE